MVSLPAHSVENEKSDNLFKTEVFKEYNQPNQATFLSEESVTVSTNHRLANLKMPLRLYACNMFAIGGRHLRPNLVNGKERNQNFLFYIFHPVLLVIIIIKFN